MAPQNRLNERLSVMLIPAKRGETLSFQTTKRRLLLFLLASFCCIAYAGFQVTASISSAILNPEVPQAVVLTPREHETIVQRLREEYDRRRSEEIAHYERLLDAERSEVVALRVASDDMAQEFSDAVTRYAEQISRLAEMSDVPLADLDLPEVTALLENDDELLLADARGGPLPGLPLQMILPRGLEVAEAQMLRLLEISEDLDEVNDLLERQQARLERTPLAMPFAASHRITDEFGDRRHPISRAWDFHNGVDFAAPHGTEVLAPADGVVAFAGRRAGYGRVVDIRHGEGLLFEEEGNARTVSFGTRFAHLSRITVEAGDRVEQGERIGLVGSSGLSTGAHLHYEVHVDGDPIDPLSIMRLR